MYVIIVLLLIMYENQRKVHRFIFSTPKVAVVEKVICKWQLCLKH